MKFTREVRSLINAAGGYRTGIVRAVSTAEGLDVEIGGGLVTGLLFLNSYAAPGIGDVVAVVGRPGAYLVLDKIGTAGATLGPNLLPNPGFEFGTVGNPPSSWNAFWSTTVDDPRVDWIDDETLAHSSGASVRFTPGELLDTQVQQLLPLDAVPVDSGVVYRIGAWWRGTANDPNTTIALRVYTAPEADGAQPGGTGAAVTDVATSTPTTGWVELNGNRTIPAGHNYLRVFLRVVANAGHTVPHVYVDDVSLRQQI